MIAFLAVTLVVLAWGIYVYNRLVTAKNLIESTFSTIDVMLKQRYDLIPNLVAAVRGYSAHENSTLTRITEMRAQAMQGSGSTDDKVRLNNEISRALGQVLVQVEAYPDLKASDNFMHLQRTLNELEEQISAARRTFNAAVMDFNNVVEMFPSKIIAGIFGHKVRSMFDIPDGERAAPAVNMSSNPVEMADR